MLLKHLRKGHLGGFLVARYQSSLNLNNDLTDKEKERCVKMFKMILKRTYFIRLILAKPGFVSVVMNAKELSFSVGFEMATTKETLDLLLSALVDSVTEYAAKLSEDDAYHGYMREVGKLKDEKRYDITRIEINPENFSAVTDSPTMPIGLTMSTEGLKTQFQKVPTDKPLDDTH